MISVKLPNMEYPVLARIQQRTKELGLTEASAAENSGLSNSAIRNIRRAWKEGKETKFSSRTLEALAPTLKTTVSWLLEGVGPKEVSHGDELASIFDDLHPDDQEHVLGLARRLHAGRRPESGKG